MIKTELTGPQFWMDLWDVELFSDEQKKAILTVNVLSVAGQF